MGILLAVVSIVGAIAQVEGGKSEGSKSKNGQTA
jgi:hypothetical protein